MRQLQVFATVNHVIRSTLHNIGFAFHVSWPWMLVLLPINLAVNLYAVNATLLGTPVTDPKLIAGAIALFLATTVAFASIAVSWHRYILRDEIPEGWARLRLDGIVWRYIGNTYLIMLIIWLAAIVIGGGLFGGAALLGVAGGEAASKGLWFLAVIVAVGLAVYSIPVVFRLMIKLPAVALGRRDYRIADAWKDSAGNNWRILGFALIIGVLLALLGGLSSLLALGLSELGFAGISVSLIVQVAVNWIGTIMGVTMLTSLYGVFHEGREV